MRSIIIGLIVLIPLNVFAVGAPDFLPDGNHPRIILDSAELTRLTTKRDASAPEWTALVAWCDSHLNDAGYDTQPPGINPDTGMIRYGLANWDGNNTYFGYRLDGFADHIRNYSLAYQVFKQSGSGQNLTKANSYAIRAKTLITSIAVNLRVGEESNGLRAIRVSDLSDTTINSSEKTALAASSESLAGQVSNISYKLGYSTRSLAYIPIAYDWLYDSLSQQDKDLFAPMMLRWYDWVKGTRSTYNNGILINGIRYYEDYGGTADATNINPPAGRTIQASDYLKMYSNFGTGHEAMMVLIPVALYGYNGDIPAYLTDAKSRLAATTINQLESDLKQSGGESVEGWNYGSGYQYLLPALYGYHTATGDTSITDMAWPKSLITSMAYRVRANKLDVPYYGYWTGTPMGVNRTGFGYNFAGVVQRLAPTSDEAKIGQHLITNTPWADTVSLFNNMLWKRSDITPLSPDGLPLSRLAKGNGMFVSKSSWNDSDAVHMMVNLRGVGAQANHEGYSQGHLTLSRSADRLLEHANAAGDNPPAASFNTVIFNNADHHANNYALTTPAIDRVEEGTSYSYVSGDITNAYKRQWNSDKALLFRRSILHVRPGFVITYDVTRSNTTLGNLKEWFTNYTSNPTQSADTITATTGNSKVFVKTLYPVVTFTETNPHTGSYRVKATPTVSQEYEQFLHVIEATGSASSQTASTLIDGTGGRGAAIGNTIAMFTKNQGGYATSTLSYSATTSAASKHYIADLVPSAQYNISINGGATTPITASTAGLIIFEDSTSGNRAYSVTQNAQNGACGSANGQTYTTPLTSDSSGLCAVGTAASFIGTVNYTWGCNGTGGGGNTTANACSATFSDVEMPITICDKYAGRYESSQVATMSTEVGATTEYCVSTGADCTPNVTGTSKKMLVNIPYQKLCYRSTDAALNVENTKCVEYRKQRRR